MWFRQYPRFSSICPHGSQILIFAVHLDYHPQILTEIALVSDERTCIPNSVFSPIQVLIKCLRIVFPRAIQPMGDRTGSVQDVSQDLYFFTVFLPFVSWKAYPNIKIISISEFWAVWEHLPILFECQVILRQLLVGHLAITSVFFLQQSSGTQTSLVQRKLRRLQSRLLQCLPRARFCLCSSAIFGSNSEFLRGDICPSMWQSGLSYFLFAPEPNSMLDRVELVPFLVHGSFCVWNLHCLWHRDKLVHQFEFCHRRKSFSSNALAMASRLQRFCLLSRGFMRLVLDFFSLLIFGFAITFVMLE